MIPTIHVRVDETLYIHGSTASRRLRAIEDEEVCLVATLLDALVLARSAFNHSMSYRVGAQPASGRGTISSEVNARGRERGSSDASGGSVHITVSGAGHTIGATSAELDMWCGPHAGARSLERLSLG